MLLEEIGYGVVVFNERENEFLLLRQKDNKINWSFPKGHAEENESPETVALRELREETGIKDILLIDNLLIHEEYEVFRNNNKKLKINEYFIGLVYDKNVKIQEDEIIEYKWISYKDAIETFISSNQETRIEVLKKAQEYIDEYEWRESKK